MRKWRDEKFGRVFFYFFRLSQALAHSRVTWFVEFRCVGGPLVVKKAVIIQGNQHATKCAVKVTCRLSTTLLVAGGRPHTGTRRTKLPGSAQEPGGVEKNKKKSKKFSSRHFLTNPSRGGNQGVSPMSAIALLGNGTSACPDEK